MKIFLIAIAIALLAGCATTPDDGQYQFGEITGSAFSDFRAFQTGYCTTASPVLRAVALSLIRARVPGYPPSGLCTDAEQALADELARQVADLEQGETIDLEQAIADQERFSNPE